jgi:DNA-binding transcriptional LysR family regulator
MKITLRQLENFLAVADLGSFSRASRRLNIAQPGLSQSVRDLEAELSVRLFDRTTRRVELTEAGHHFLNSAGKTLEDIEYAVESVRELATCKRGRLRIAAPPLLSAVILPHAIAEFRSCYPGIMIQIADVCTEQIVANVRSGKADCGLGTFSPAEEGVERTPLVRDSLIVLCGRGSAFEDATSVRWRQLEGEPIITLARDSAIRLLVEVGFEACQIPFTPLFEVNQITTAVALVEAGLGLAVLPAYSMAVARHRAIAGRPLVEPSISRDVVMVHATGRSVSPAVSALSPIVRRYAVQLATNAS